MCLPVLATWLIRAIPSRERVVHRSLDRDILGHAGLLSRLPERDGDGGGRASDLVHPAEFGLQMGRPTLSLVLATSPVRRQPRQVAHVEA
jgi:hypothetical protein